MTRIDVLQHAVTMAARFRREHGVFRAAGMLAVRALARLSGGTVLACMHKPVAEVHSCAGRLLTCEEIGRMSRNPALDLPAAFVNSTRQSDCYGVVVDERVRCYAWTSPEPVRAVPGTMVRMPARAAYVFKAFTDPAFRRRGLLRECLRAIEQTARRSGRHEMTALVEIHNRSSLRAFRNAGFDRCGYVLVWRRPWFVRHLGCRCESPCEWSPVHDADTAGARTSRDRGLGIGDQSNAEIKY